jgi:hypothetical protein
MDNLLKGIPGVCVYLDDILVTGKTACEHRDALETVLTILQENGMRIKRSKCEFNASAVSYLGHKIDATGLHPLQEKVEAISNAPVPKNLTELRSYLGLLNFYGRFLPNLSTVVAPMNYLMRKGVSYTWTASQENAFKESKELLKSSKVLVHYDQKKKLLLACDASPYGLGTVLSHVMDDGTEQPIGFASRTLSDCETRYSQLDKEALALVFGVKRFHQYLYGRHFMITTDHKPLLGLFGPNRSIPHMASPRVQRWGLTMGAYSYSLVFKPGAANGNADAMSRLPLPVTVENVPVPGDVVFLLEHLKSNTVSVDNIKSGTQRDPTLAKVLHFVKSGWPGKETSVQLRPYAARKHELSVEDNCLLWGSRVIIPPQAQKAVLEELHETHVGMQRMKTLARSYVWWPGLDLDIEAIVGECNICQLHRKPPAEAPLHPWEWPGQPWERLHIDYAGPFQGKMFLILIDAHSKWIDAHVVSSATSTATIEKLMETFAIHGLPKSIVSDNGSCFTSEEFRNFTRSNGILHTCTAPYHPSSNGLAERAVQTVKMGLKKILDGTLEMRLSRFLARYRLTPQSSTGVSPAELLLKRRPRSKLDLLYPDTSVKVHRSQALQKAQHDRHARARFFEEGDIVFVTNFGRGDARLPGEIWKKTGPLSFIVCLTDGRKVRRHQDHIQLRCSEEPPDVTLPLEGTLLPSDMTFDPAQTVRIPETNSVSDKTVDTSIMHPVTPPDAIEQPSIVPLRRSQRNVKPPDRYGD